MYINNDIPFAWEWTAHKILVKPNYPFIMDTNEVHPCEIMDDPCNFMGVKAKEACFLYK